MLSSLNFANPSLFKGQEIKKVSIFKLFNDKLTWHDHVE